MLHMSEAVVGIQQILQVHGCSTFFVLVLRKYSYRFTLCIYLINNLNIKWSTTQLSRYSWRLRWANRCPPFDRLAITSTPSHLLPPFTLKEIIRTLGLNLSLRSTLTNLPSIVKSLTALRRVKAISSAIVTLHLFYSLKIPSCICKDSSIWCPHAIICKPTSRKVSPSMAWITIHRDPFQRQSRNPSLSISFWPRK